MPSTHPFDTIPETPGEWLIAATRARVQDMTLRRFDKHNSASKVSKPQYLCFRTLVIPRKPQSFKPAQWDMTEQVDTATEELDQSGHFQSFLTDIRNGHPPATGEFRTIPDMYTPVLREVDASYPGRLQRHDETAVNTSLMLLHTASRSMAADEGPLQSDIYDTGRREKRERPSQMASSSQKQHMR